MSLPGCRVFSRVGFAIFTCRSLVYSRSCPFETFPCPHAPVPGLVASVCISALPDQICEMESSGTLRMSASYKAVGHSYPTYLPLHNVTDTPASSPVLRSRIFMKYSKTEGIRQLARVFCSIV